MSNREKTTTTLGWTRKKEWGSAGMTYRAHLDHDGHTYSFCLDHPYKNGPWVLRIWKDGVMNLYRECLTVARGKDRAVEYAENEMAGVKDA